MAEFIICCSILALIAYLLFFKYELVYKITESWKSYSSSDGTLTVVYKKNTSQAL